MLEKRKVWQTGEQTEKILSLAKACTRDYVLLLLIRRGLVERDRQLDNASCTHWRLRDSRWAIRDIDSEPYPGIPLSRIPGLARPKAEFITSLKTPLTRIGMTARREQGLQRKRREKLVSLLSGVRGPLPGKEG